MKAPEPTYKNIKLLGTKLDTQSDIAARKTKVWGPMKRHRNYFKSKRLSVAHKVRIYRTYVEPILLYNSETWALTTTMEKRLDSFHRKLLRISLNYIYPKTISNEKLYTLTKEVPISSKIKKRRLSLLGHILRLHPETPVQKALEHYLTPLPRPVGRPPLTWIALITKDLENISQHHQINTPLTKESLAQLKHIAEDRSLWRREISGSTERNL